MSASRKDAIDIDPPVLRVAVPVPLRKTFDYLPLPDQPIDSLRPGMRVLVPFGRHSHTGYLTEISNHTETDATRLRIILAVLDEAPLLTSTDVELLRWAASYYHHPLGEVMAAAFPVLLRAGRRAEIPGETHFRATELGRSYSPDLQTRARRSNALLKLLQCCATGVSATQLREIDPAWRKGIEPLIRKGLAEVCDAPDELQQHPALPRAQLPLNPAQLEAVRAVTGSLGRHSTFLLDGVTGSGKTEVYLRVTEAVLQRGGQVMVLLPEISLTPQLEQRFLEYFSTPVAVFHSRLRETERLTSWLRFRSGKSPILLGTRSAVFVPIKSPGLIIIDEEHDASFKQQENFRFSARDVAIRKAQLLGIPVVLGSATPSLESLWNVERGRYQALSLPTRAGGAAKPELRLLDIRHQRLQQGLSPHLVLLIRKVLSQQEQVLLFLNRRGYAPTLICNDCGWVAPCSLCDARLVVHLRDHRLRCHYCGHERKIPLHCPKCSGSELRPLGQGTERLEQSLGELFPDSRVVRIDRDSTRRTGSLQRKLNSVHSGDVDILLGTQMLAKGHHFPRVTLVAIVDVDALLFATDFRASERMAQLIVQVAGRAGRAERPGTVVLQTRHPADPLLKTLIEEGYRGYAAAALSERRLARLPPFSHMAIWRAEARDDRNALQFMQQLRDCAYRSCTDDVAILGPAPAPMLRLGDRYRYQLALSAPKRKSLHTLISRLERDVLAFALCSRVRWSVDVDPIDCY